MKIYIIIVCHYMYYKNEINKKKLDENIERCGDLFDSKDSHTMQI